MIDWAIRLLGRLAGGPLFREAERLHDEGARLLEKGRIQESRELLSRALELYRHRGNERGEMYVSGRLANACHASGDSQRARDLQQRRLDLARRIGRPREEALALGDLGVLHMTGGDFAAAMDHFQQQLAFAKEKGDLEIEELAVGNLGYTFYLQGRYDEAVEQLERALELDEILAKPAMKGNTLLSLGLACQGKGEYGKSLGLMQRSLQIAREVEDSRAEGFSLTNLGNLHHLMGQTDKAISCHKEALGIYRKLGDRYGILGLLGNLGVAQVALGETADARKSFEEALLLARDSGSSQAEGFALANLAKVAVVEKDYHGALALYEESLTLRKRIDDRRGIVYSWLQIGLTWRALSNLEKALDCFQEAFRLVKDLGDAAGEGLVLQEISIIDLLRQDFASAERSLRQVVRLWDEARYELGGEEMLKISLFEQHARTSQLLQRALVAQEKIEPGLEAAEHGRAQVLAGLLARHHARVSEFQEEALAIDEIRRIAKTQKATLVIYSLLQDYTGTESNSEREMVLLTWVVPPTGPVGFHQEEFQVADGELRRSPAEVLAAGRRAAGLGREWRQRSPEADLEVDALYDLLIRPIQGHLPQEPGASIVFIPQSVLLLVPFAALHGDDGFLVDRYTISIAPSIRILDLSSRQAAKETGRTAGALVVGNPKMPRIERWPGAPFLDLEDLPGAEREAEAIAGLFRTRPLLREEATKERVLEEMPGRRTLHFATHGLLDNESAVEVPGALVLAGGTAEEALLTAGEILDLQLDADLVVLSACNTGQGKVRSDGIVGLSRSFLSAGVPSTVVSLWSVPDAPTAFLMTRFHEELLRGAGKAEALRQAMLDTKKDHPDPVDWAGFVLIGDRGTLARRPQT